MEDPQAQTGSQSISTWVFGSQISECVYESIMYATQHGIMCVNQRRGVQYSTNSETLKKWRPLTLLNSDYKIFAKTMTLRLQQVLDTIISTDLYGCIKGRATFPNKRSIIDSINYVNEFFFTRYSYVH